MLTEYFSGKIFDKSEHSYGVGEKDNRSMSSESPVGDSKGISLVRGNHQQP